MELIQLKPGDLTWDMGRDDNVNPGYMIKIGSYPRKITVDPYPCYTHDMPLAAEVLRLCEDKFHMVGPGLKTGLYVIPHEFLGRSNGLTFEETTYYGEDGKDVEYPFTCKCGCAKELKLKGHNVTIVLSGKRIPILPAMTRYLVSHEYGHAIFNHIRRLYGYEEQHKYKLEKEYMALRGVTDYATDYRGGGWHRSPGEIIANDFRILFTGMETEFWPHECSAPSWDTPYGLWWTTAHRAITGGTK